MKKIIAVFKARNIEFFRDRSSLAWNILFPVLMIFGFALIFSDTNNAEYKVGVLGDIKKQSFQAFRETRYIDFVTYGDEKIALDKLRQHQIELLIDLNNKGHYWVNNESSKGYLLESILQGRFTGVLTREVVQGRVLRYVDWALPGILGMNIMFSCLFGVGYVIVRYRKNGVLKRLKATPLSAFEFLLAQVLSRLFISILVSIGLFVGCDLIFDFYMRGSYWLLLLITLLGSMSLIALSLLMTAMTQSEEFAGGLLNMVSWPMMFLSGVWFSLEGAPGWLQSFAKIFPLTHMLDGARAVMIEGAGVIELLPVLLTLTLMTLFFISIGAWKFNWGNT